MMACTTPNAAAPPTMKATGESGGSDLTGASINKARRSRNIRMRVPNHAWIAPPDLPSRLSFSAIVPPFAAHSAVAEAQ